MPQTLRVLTRNRDFRRLFLAELVMFGGDWFVMIPLLTLLPELTGSGLWGGLVLAVDTGIVALLMPFTGAVADRRDRRVIMLTANAAGLVAVLALLLVRSSGTAWVAVAAVAAFAVAKAFYTPAASAAFPNLVAAQDLPAATMLATSAWGTMLVVGASLGGLLSAAVGPYACFLVTAGCLVVAAGQVWSIRRPMQAERSGDPQRTFSAIAEGARYIARTPRVAALVTVKSAVGLGNGVLAAFPLFAVLLHAGSAGTGLLFAARGVGVVLGPLLMRRVLAHRSWLLPGLAVSMGAYGLLYIGVGVAPWFWLALLLVIGAHIAGGGNWVMSSYALQTEVPDELRGRVYGTDIMIATLAVSASVLLVGLFVDSVSARVLMVLCGATTLGYAVVWRLLTLRLLRPAPEPAGGLLPAPARDAAGA